MDKNKKFYLTIRPQTTYIVLQDIVAKIEFTIISHSVDMVRDLRKAMEK